MVGRPVLTTVKRLASLLRKQGIDFSHMLLFGSHATGFSSAQSDIDICLVLESGSQDHIDYVRREANSLAGRNGLAVDVIVTTKKELETNHLSPILHEIRKHGQKVPA